MSEEQQERPRQQQRSQQQDPQQQRPQQQRPQQETQQQRSQQQETPQQRSQQQDPQHRSQQSQQSRRPNGGRRFDRRRPTLQKPPTNRVVGSVSVVVPLLNEEESLEELSKQLETVLERIARGRYEVIFIDDGSTDSSFAVIQKINAGNSRFKCIRFRTNHGKSAALAVGFAEATGDYVITMDADLQDDPNEIPGMIAKLDEGFDLVSGWKRKRYDPWHKTLPSKLFNSVTSRMSGLKLHDFNCGLKAYRSDVVKTVQVYGEMHRYIPALAHWEGFRVTEVPVQHRARQFGVSKFGMSRFLKGYLDLLTVMFTTRYVKRPLHFFGALGSLFAIIGFVTDLYLAIEKWAFGIPLSQRPYSLLFGIAMIIVGVQLISIGLIGELIVKNNLSEQRFSIRERLS
jgi:glycosyltransferase involved in cell wall biosynthesis